MYYATQGLVTTLCFSFAIIFSAGIGIILNKELKKKRFSGIMLCIISCILIFPIFNLKQNLTLENEEQDLIHCVEIANSNLNNFYILHPEMKK